MGPQDAPKAWGQSKLSGAEQLPLCWANPLPNSTFPLCCDWIYSQHKALCDCTHLTLVFEGRFHKSQE